MHNVTIQKFEFLIKFKNYYYKRLNIIFMKNINKKFKILIKQNIITTIKFLYSLLIKNIKHFSQGKKNYFLNLNCNLGQLNL